MLWILPPTKVIKDVPSALMVGSNCFLPRTTAAVVFNFSTTWIKTRIFVGDTKIIQNGSCSIGKPLVLGYSTLNFEKFPYQENRGFSSAWFDMSIPCRFLGRRGSLFCLLSHRAGGAGTHRDGMCHSYPWIAMDISLPVCMISLLCLKSYNNIISYP